MVLDAKEEGNAPNGSRGYSALQRKPTRDIDCLAGDAATLV